MWWSCRVGQFLFLHVECMRPRELIRYVFTSWFKLWRDSDWSRWRGIHVSCMIKESGLWSYNARGQVSWNCTASRVGHVRESIPKTWEGACTVILLFSAMVNSLSICSQTSSSAKHFKSMFHHSQLFVFNHFIACNTSTCFGVSRLFFFFIHLLTFEMTSEWTDDLVWIL